MNPRVSIILPTWNGSKYITKALDSVLAQTFSDWELIIINDGSTDNTEEIVGEYVKKDKRVRYYYHNNKGQEQSRKYGIELSNGKYIAFIDDDDVWIDKNKIEKQIEFMDENSGYVLLGTGGIVCDENYNKISGYKVSEKDKDIKNTFLYKNNFIQSSVVLRKNILSNINFSNEEKYKVAEDYNLWLKIGLLGKVANINESMVMYMYREGNTSFKNKKYILKNNIRIIKNYRNKYPNFLRGLILSYLKYVIFSIVITFLGAHFYKILFKFNRKFI